MAQSWGTRAVPASLVAGVALTTVVTMGVTVPVAAVELSALIIGASSTNPSGDGVAGFYGGLYRQAGQDPVVANFFTGPFGIRQAIAAHATDPDNVVLSSGWGAANASLLLSYGQLTHDPAVTQPRLYVLDNNVASPNGGFGTRLPAFAVIGVNPIPTPTDPGVPVVNVVYEYDINSNIPAYLWNAPSMANSLMAYFDRRLNQDSLDFPVDAAGNVRDCDDACHADLDSGATLVRNTASGAVRISRVDDTTYVGYETENLPLVSPLRAFGEVGNRLADAATPALRAVVDYGYPDNDPLANPQKYVAARLVPTAKETERFVKDFTDGVEEGAAILRGSADRSKPDAPAARPTLRTSLDFSPKALRHDRAPGAHRAGVGPGSRLVAGVRAWAKKLRGGKATAPAASEPDKADATDSADD